jgi:hypothetical protein
MNINSQVQVIKDCGRRGEIGRLIGREKTQMTIYTPSGTMWSVEFEDGIGRYFTEELREVEE